MRPLVISHAACGGHAAENTLAGIRKAIELGAEAIEVDVQASKDGVPVLMHDFTVNRTTNGSGGVFSLSVDELRMLDVGGEPVPTLAEALDLTTGRVLLVMEIKQPGIEQNIVRIVRQSKALNEVMVWSFLPPVIVGIRREEPLIPTALIVPAEALPRWPDLKRRALMLGAQGVSVSCVAVDQAVAEDCLRSGLALYTWTPDCKKEIARLVGLGVDGVCSNFPEIITDVLAGR